MGKGAKFNKEALNQMMKQQAMKERMKAKIDAKKNYTLEKNANNNLVFHLSEEEKQEKTVISERACAELLANLKMRNLKTWMNPKEIFQKKREG